MTPQNASSEEFVDLIHDLAEGRISPQQADRLDEFLCADPIYCRHYVDFMAMVVGLSWIEDEENEQADWMREGQSPNNVASWAVDLKSEIHESQSLEPVSEASFPMPEPIPVPHFSLGNVLHGTVGFFSQEIPFSLLMATIVSGLGLWAASLIYVTHHKQIADSSSVSKPTPSAAKTDIEFIGRVTGMADVQWADDQTVTVHGANVPMGRKYAMASGLMEITYDTGAKVILQGPVTYEANSRDGGYLSLGKLTAKLEKKTEDGRRKTEDSNLSSLSTIHNPLFTVKTPTAIVTDLGTEFGVEVSKEGNTTSHVYLGSVEMRAVAADGKAEDKAEVLHENQSARVEKNSGKQGGGNRVTVIVSPSNPVDFVRDVPRLTIKKLDLVDVVAGGNGFSGRRNGGIDPTTGRAINTRPEQMEMWFKGDQTYHRVDSLPLVDGVFIPNSQMDRVQVDSAGHVFTEFPKTDNMTACYIWAGGFVDNKYPHMTVLEGIDYGTPGHGALFLHANKGITFKLDAIRAANPGCSIKGFLAVAGNSETGSEESEPALADVWVLVDGEVRYRRREINRYNRAFSIAVPIGPSEHFLTLAATDGGNGFKYDWIVFGDPRLELAFIGQKPQAEVPRPMAAEKGDHP